MDRSHEGKTIFTSRLKWKIVIASGTIIAAALTVTLAWRTAKVTAQSGPWVWTTDVMTCVPNGPTTQNDLVWTSFGMAEFQVGKTGNIDLACAFSDASLQGITVREIEMTYVVARGPGAAQARLRAIGKVQGDYQDVLDVTSNVGCANVTTVHKCSSKSLSHVLDFNKFYYYVLLSMSRSTDTTQVRLVGASIGSAP